MKNVVADAGMVYATVRGTHTYEVSVGFNSRHRAVTRCTCPFAADNSACKHGWAVLLAAEAAGAFDTPGGLPPREARPSSPAWKQRLSGLRRVAAQPIAPRDDSSLDQPLTYRLDFEHLRSSGEVVIDVQSSGRPAAFSDGAWLHSTDPADRDLAHLLLGATTSYNHVHHAPSRRFVIPVTMYDKTLREIVSTGRCIRLHRSDPASNATLHWDADVPWTVHFALRPDQTSSHYELRASLERDGLEMSVDDPLVVTAHGLVLIRDTISCFYVEDAWPLLSVLRIGGPITVPAEDLFDVAAELLTMQHAPHIELPDGAVQELHPQPVPRVLIRTPRYEFDPSLPLSLEFIYDGVTVPESDPGRAIIDRERRVVLHRDRDREQAARARLLELGARIREHWRADATEMIVPARAVTALVHALVQEDWHVEMHGRRYRAATSTAARVRSGIDWFEVEADVSFGAVHAELPQLLLALQRKETVVQLEDGSLGVLPLEWLRRFERIAAVASTAVTSKSAPADVAPIRLARAQAGLLDLLLAEQPDVDVDETFERIRDEMQSFTHIAPQAEPPGFQGTLRPYQQQALGWFSFLRRLQLGGCLADDMGLGKTVQVLALLEQRRLSGDGPSLVIVPKSLVFNWANEAARFTPLLRVRDYTGIDRKSASIDPAEFDVLITTYGTLRRDAPELSQIEFDYIILDEAQAIKNANTLSWKAARLLRARHRLALSGTPIENDISELWSLFEFLNPGMLGAARGFKTFEQDALRQVLRPFILRRTKEQVAPELPPRTEQTLFVELDKQQRTLYDSLREHYRRALLQHIDDVGIKRSKIQILEALLRLRQAAIHPGLIDTKRTAESSAKLDILMQKLEEIIGEGHRALVFSQFTSVLAIVRDRLTTAGITFEYLDGRTRDRQARVERFQSDPSCSVFLISLRAGGYGLNLTAADYVFVLDPWWNPAVEAQAIDRAHRIGQDKHVIALRLIARDTVEEKVLELQDSKRSLADAIIGADAGFISSITREDLQLLLG